jgi:hypothetical protein
MSTDESNPIFNIMSMQKVFNLRVLALWLIIQECSYSRNHEIPTLNSHMFHFGTYVNNLSDTLLISDIITEMQKQW